MNLPPIPDNLPPLDTPPPTPFSPIPGASTPGQRARIILSVSVIAVGLLVVVASLLSPRPPSESAVKSFINGRLAKEGFKVENVEVGESTYPADGRAIYRIECESVSDNEARYDLLSGEPVHPGESLALPDWLKLDQIEWKRCQELISGPYGSRLVQIAGLDPRDEALLHLTLLREVRAAGPQRCHIYGYVVAERRGLRWLLDWNPSSDTIRSQQSGEGPGRPLSAFSAPLCIVERAADKERLTDLAARFPGIHSRLEQAIPALFAQNKPALMALLKPVAFFRGVASGSVNNSPVQVHLLLQITETRDESNGIHLTALLRNDGSWTDVRMFSGTLAFGGTGRFELVLTPEDGGSSSDLAGPFLTDHANGFELPEQEGNVRLPLSIDGNVLVWNAGEVSLKLERCTQGEEDGFKSSIEAERAMLIEAVKPGLVYAGTITDRITGAIENCQLRMVAFDPNGQKVTATIERSGLQAWSTSISGKLETNRYRDDAGKISFDSFDGDLPDDLRPTWSAIFPMLLTVGRDNLQDEKPRHIIHLERVTKP